MEKLNIVTVETETDISAVNNIDFRLKLTVNLDNNKLLSIHTVGNKNANNQLLLTEEDLSSFRWVNRQGILLDYKRFLKDWLNVRFFVMLENVLTEKFKCLGLVNWYLIIFEIYEALEQTYKSKL